MQLHTMPIDTKEDWRPVVGYEPYYEISNLGRIRSLDRVVPHIGTSSRKLRGRLLKQKINKQGGYPFVELCAPDGHKTCTIHTLVAAAFIGPRPDGLEVCHGDGDTTNCRHDNLRYDTPKNNRADSLRHGTLARGERSPKAKLTEAHVRAIRSDKRPLLVIAGAYGVSVSTVSRARNGVDWAHVV